MPSPRRSCRAPGRGSTASRTSMPRISRTASGSSTAASRSWSGHRSIPRITASRPMALRCVYTDLDGTMLGRGASLLRDAEGNFSTLAIRALEACHRAGVEVVIKSGRRKAQVYEDARIIGQQAYIYEMGCGLVDGPEELFLTGELQPREDATVHDQIERSGAPRLLLDTYPGRIEIHTPWHTDRLFSHLFRGNVDLEEVHALFEREGQGDLRLVDN